MWDSLYERYRQRTDFSVLAEARALLHAGTDLSWLAAALGDPERKRFVVAILLKDKQLPEPLFEPLIRAAVDEPDPKFKRAFVAPCVRAFGLGRTREALQRIFEAGLISERAGASGALAWAPESGDARP